MSTYDRQSQLDMTAGNVVVIAALAEAEPDRAVASCPDWRLRDLAFHLACVLDMWTQVVGAATLERCPPGTGMTPPPDDALASYLHERCETYLDVLGHASETTPAWNWWNDPTARLIPWRTLHETVVHRWDTEQAVQAPTPIDPELAADGVQECLTLYAPLRRPCPKHLTGTLALRAEDIGASWLVDLPSLRPADDPPDANLRGTAEDLLLVLWGRRAGDRLVADGDTDLVRGLCAHLAS